MKRFMFAGIAVLATAVSAGAEIKADETARLAKAAEVLRETRSSIPDDLWAKAHCVVVLPDLKKAAFIFGGEYGKGAMSCRAGETWSAPVFMQLAKGSWGFQAGAEEVDVVMLVMNESGMQKLMKNNVALGVDASIAAGPIGRQGTAGTDATLTAEILAYSRAKGLFAGINLSGGALRPDEDANKDAYGADATPSTVLASRSISAPPQAAPFLQALGATAAPAPTATSGSQETR
jgi:lipid-binding SYLF domain-containing protein